MKKKGSYRTRQQEEILLYLQQNPDKHLNVSQIVTHLKSKGSSIGVTTVYRQLEKLVDQGVLQKYATDGGPACFQYLDGCLNHPHFHMKCLECGHLLHMECAELDDICRHMRSAHNFELNSMKTTFYGLCEDCIRHSSQN